jgi:hypothetical protein
VESKDFEIKIKKGNNVFITKRSEFVSCSETADGIVFQTKNGLLLHYTDNRMDSATKMRIKLTIDNMSTGNILVDLDNVKNPAQFFAVES